MGAVPRDDLGEKFRDVHRRARARLLQHALEREAEPQSADEHAATLLPFVVRATDGAKQDLGRRDGGVHELLAVHPDAETAVVLDQRHARPIRGFGLGQRDVRFHSSRSQDAAPRDAKPQSEKADQAGPGLSPRDSRRPSSTLLL